MRRESIQGLPGKSERSAFGARGWCRSTFGSQSVVFHAVPEEDYVGDGTRGCHCGGQRRSYFEHCVD